MVIIKKKFKILKIYLKYFEEEYEESSVNLDFITSKGWFKKFKKRFGIDSIRI